MKKTVKLLIFSDVFMLTGFGLIAPIFAIFIKEGVAGGSIGAVGIATAIFIGLKASLQLLFAQVFTKKDRRWMVLLGTFLVASVAFLYAFSSKIWHVYIAQAIYGIGAAFAFPAWLSLFTTNLTKGREGLEWSIYSSITGVSTAAAAWIGALLVERIGFKIVFLLVGMLAIAGGLVLLGLEKKQKEK